MNKDLIETPRFNFFIGDEVLLKGKIVGFDVDENKCVENVVRLEYGQTINVPNSTIHITNNIVDKSKIKVKVPQFVADWIEKVKKDGLELKDRFGVYGKITAAVSVYSVMNCILEERVAEKEITNWVIVNTDTFARAWLDGYEVEEEKRYLVKIKGDIKENMLVYGEVVGRYFFTKSYSLSNARYPHTRKELEQANFGWVFDCPGIEIEEVE